MNCDIILTYLNMMCRYWIPGWHMLPSRTIPRMQRRQAFILLSNLTSLYFQGLSLESFSTASVFTHNSSLEVAEAIKSHSYYGQMSGVQIPEGNPKHSPTSGEMAIYKAHCLMLRKVVSNHFLCFTVCTQKISVRYVIFVQWCLGRATNENG